MCGIAGVIALNSAPSMESDPLGCIVELVAKCLTHRGPDASGLWKSPSGRIALDGRRLAIIDLTDTGRQPMDYAERLRTRSAAHAVSMGSIDGIERFDIRVPDTIRCGTPMNSLDAGR